MKLIAGITLLGLALAGGHATADEARFSFGGDQFVAGQAATINQPIVERDAFAAGYDVGLTGAVQGDAHLAGFNVHDDAQVIGDTYAAGFLVSIAGSTGGDLTAIGNTVSVTSAAPVTGNVRLAGSLVTVSAPVGGAALITAANFTLDAPVAGDLSFFGEKLTFGPNARVSGKLIIQAPAEISVPASVAPAERVSFVKLVTPDYASQASKTAEHVVNAFWPAVWATGVWWLLLFVVGLAFIGLSARSVERMRAVTATRPFRNLGYGVVAFAAVIGLVPISAMTLIGLLVTPLFVLFAVAMCALAYLAGVFLLGVLLIRRLTKLDTMPKQALALAVSIVAAGLLATLPVVGWLITLLVVIFGYGAIAQLIFGRRVGDAGPAAGATVPAPTPAAA